MSDRFKFRAWNGKRMVGWRELVRDWGDLALVFEWPTHPSWVIMQSIGRMDKNDKLIYEGDICENGDWEADANTYNHRREVVEWDDYNACWNGWNPCCHGMTCEVIGNIYENENLLK